MPPFLTLGTVPVLTRYAGMLTRGSEWTNSLISEGSTLDTTARGKLTVMALGTFQTFILGQAASHDKHIMQNSITCPGGSMSSRDEQSQTSSVSRVKDNGSAPCTLIPKYYTLNSKLFPSGKEKDSKKTM